MLHRSKVPAPSPGAPKAHEGEVAATRMPEARAS